MNINQIAKLAGVSPAAVSRYLNNGYLSAEKRQAIAKVIEETGYIPSSQAQTLRTKKTKIIGVIIPKIDSDSISQVVAGIGEVLNENGYQMLLANTDNHEEKEIEFINTFKQNIVDGIILLGTVLTTKHKKALKDLTIPYVVLGQQTDISTCIFHDDYTASFELADYMINKGHKKIGYIGVTEKDIAVGANRKKGFLDALENHNIKSSPELIKTGSFYMDNGYENAKALLSQNKDIDAILCATDTIALGAIKYLNENNIKIPDDIAVAGFGESKPSSILSPSLTTVHFYYRECGVEGATFLLDKITKPDIPDKAMKLGFEIIKNQSV
jgi:LacI family sucrose operon transcriptional repressor